MLRFALLIGLLLIAVSVVSFLKSEASSVTMWIPAMLGGAVMVGVALARRWPGNTCGLWVVRLVSLAGLGAYLFLSSHQSR